LLEKKKRKKEKQNLKRKGLYSLRVVGNVCWLSFVSEAKLLTWLSRDQQTQREGTLRNQPVEAIMRSLGFLALVKIKKHAEIALQDLPVLCPKQSSYFTY